MDINVINSARPFALVLLLKDSDPSQKKKKNEDAVSTQSMSK
jgi:hypothetical protein